MLRDAAAFDITFKQPGQSGFFEDLEMEVLEMEVLEMEVLEMEVLEMEVLEIEVMEILCCVNILDARTIPVRNSRNNTNQGCSLALADGANTGSVTASGLALPDDRAGGHRQLC
jgi:hypothetical protein